MKNSSGLLPGKRDAGYRWLRKKVNLYVALHLAVAAAYCMYASRHEMVCFRKRNAASTDVLLSFRPLAENPRHPRGGLSLERAP